MSNYSGAKGGENIFQKLHSIQLGGGNGPKIKKRDLIFFLRNVSILVENGLSLPRSLETLVKEPSLRKYSAMLEDIKSRVESGEAFSGALAQYPESFDLLIISQIRIGERSGTIPTTLGRIMHQLENSDNLRSQIIKKLSYPALLVTAGTAAVTFMLLYVIPTFEGIYSDNGADLPAITQLLIDVGAFVTTYGWMILLAIAAFSCAFVAARRNESGRFWMDSNLIKIPMLGKWFKNIAVLQFMEVLGNLMESGFTVVEALDSCASAVGNRAVRKKIQEMHVALTRGERFSDELSHHADLFPPVVNQLVIVGEKTGTLPKTTVHIRAHLRKEVETYTNVMVGTIEPVMTAGLATTIGCILLAIYLPMFDMISAMNAG